MTTTLAEQNEALVRRAVTEVNNERDLSNIPEYAAETYVMYDPGYPETVRGREELRTYAQALLAGSSDLHVSLNTVLANERIVTSAWRLTGTHDGPWGQLPPTGRHFDITRMTLSRVAGGKIQEECVYYDTREFFDQLGLTFPSVIALVLRLAWEKLKTAV